MPREFVPFDRETIRSEQTALAKSSRVDAAKLDYCVIRLQTTDPKDNPTPAIVKNFGQGLFELRHMSPEYAGRLLFYEAPPRAGGMQILVMLRVFRKGSQSTPQREIQTALQRMAKDRENRREEGS